MGKVGNLQLEAGDKSGKLVAELIRQQELHWNAVIVRDFSSRIQRGDKIGVIGPNGAGDDAAADDGELQPDSGIVRQGTKIEVAYLTSSVLSWIPDSSLIDVISPGSDFVEIGGARGHVIGYLEGLFAPERSRSVSSFLRWRVNRLPLARLFAKPANASPR